MFNWLYFWVESNFNIFQDGATALFKAAHKGHSAVVQELLKYRPMLGILPNGETSLHAACLFGHLPIVKQLIVAGSDIMIKNQDGLTPLQVAKQQKYINVVEYLLEKEREITLLCKGTAPVRVPMNLKIVS